MNFKLDPLPYDSASLEPHIDQKTMEIHHGRHHNAYVTNLNKALEGNQAAANKSLEDLMKEISNFGAGVRNNGGGHYNHSLFWSILSGEPTKPSENLQKAIEAKFGNLEAMKEKINQAGATRFGSGWAWLIVKDGELEVTSTPNQDNPLMDIAEVKGTPIIGIDVWEHAYYLKYENKRPDYLSAIWNVINWDEVSRRYEEAIK
ncbi:MAG TPA: superoxide dismutase [Chitinophagaceae bacterium]|nr:superoxide dismutase [Chitinophagaceae bacterium]